MTEWVARLFEPDRDAAAGRLSVATIAGLYVAGLVGWSYVMGWGAVPLDFHDWTGINLPRLLFLQESLRNGAWPLHMTGGAALHDVTDRFFALPDVITSPQTLLLLFMPVERFVLADVLLQYSLGFWGLVLLRRYLQWSPYAFTLVYLLFIFNGHILSHYSVGHLTWGPYFLFSFVALFILRFLDGDRSVRLLAWFALVMAYMILAGGQHHMTWVLLMLALLVPFCWRQAWWLVAVAAASGLLSAVRLLPPVLELSSFRQAGLVSDVIGFPSLAHMGIALVMLRREFSSFNIALPGNIWFFDNAFFEFNAFIGVAGLALVVFGAAAWLRTATPRYAALIVPLFGMMALSLGSTYRLVRLTGIPMLDGERYTARMFALPLLLLIVMAAASLDRVLRRPSTALWHRVLALIALLYAALDIAASVRLWRVAVSSGLFKQAPFDPRIVTPIDRADPQYVTVLLAGLAISVVTAIVLLWLAARAPAPPPPRTE